MASDEVDALVAFVREAVPAAKVTDINTPGVHSSGSFHYAQGTGGSGLAVDFAGPKPGDVVVMTSIFNALKPTAPKLAELIFKAPGITKAVKNGAWLDGIVCYGTTVWSAHANHVHVAVPKGTVLAAPDVIHPLQVPSVSAPRKVAPMFDPPIRLEPVVADLACPTGGTWLFAATGAVYAFGGAPFLGSPFQKPYFSGRTAARLELVQGRYQVVAESGETYGPGF